MLKRTFELGQTVRHLATGQVGVVIVAHDSVQLKYGGGAVWLDAAEFRTPQGSPLTSIEKQTLVQHDYPHGTKGKIVDQRIVQYITSSTGTQGPAEAFEAVEAPQQ